MTDYNSILIWPSDTECLAIEFLKLMDKQEKDKKH